ncbi:ImmA/IrrE family metallo-endopeptidase [Microbacterium sp. Leaf179]|uniref:ImmA/IrrE family metallo-endopeptidase n=1 Tax=Microbacterium sp. Leaf179 TaxID=1736288 RepID=UPI0012E365D0|nr:ImmA/IrrE family metallo-endopeptidase [Microbacterium sp. Leaf179]
MPTRRGSQRNAEEVGPQAVPDRPNEVPLEGSAQRYGDQLSQSVLYRVEVIPRIEDTGEQPRVFEQPVQEDGSWIDDGRRIEREADMFAAEFLTPARVMESRLKSRLDMTDVLAVSEEWGVEPRSVVYRSRELGKVSEATARRGYIRLNQIDIPHEPVARFPGELPSLLSKAVELAEQRGTTIPKLARELAWTPAHVRRMLGAQDDRPHLTLAV